MISHHDTSSQSNNLPPYKPAYPIQSTMSSHFKIYDERATYPRCYKHTYAPHHNITHDTPNLRYRNPSAGAFGTPFSLYNGLTTGASQRAHGIPEYLVEFSVFVGGGRGHGGGEGHIRPPILVDTRRSQRETEMVNQSITTNVFWSEVHPKATYDESLSREFSSPRTADDLTSMNGSGLDRARMVYGHTESRWDERYRPHRENRKQKLWRLLGTDHLTSATGAEEEEVFYARHQRQGR